MPTRQYVLSASVDDALAIPYGLDTIPPTVDATQKGKFGVFYGTFWTYLRYLLDIPKGSTILSAKLLFVCKMEADSPPEGETGLFTANVGLLDLDDCPPFDNAILATPIITRVPYPITEAWTAESVHESVDITLLIQQFINRSGYVANNYCGLVLDHGNAIEAPNSQARSFYSYDLDPSKAVVLEVTFTTLPTHVLTVTSEPISIPVAVNAISVGDTPVSVQVTEGENIVNVPLEVTDEVTTYRFIKWEDNSTNPTRIINVISDTTIIAYYEEVAPPLPGKGTLEVHAFSNSEEVIANVEIVTIETRTTPFILDLDPGTYALVATYHTQTKTVTAQIIDGELTRVDFQFLSRCFIATAAYGTPLTPELDVLRRFRDRCLPTLIVEAYYALSPPIADAIRPKNAIRAIIRALLKPIIRLLSG